MTTIAITCWDSFTNESSAFIQPYVNRPTTVDELLNHYADASGEDADTLSAWKVTQTFEAGTPGTSGWTVVVVQRSAGTEDLCTLAFVVY